MADAAAFFDDTAGDSGGNWVRGGDIREIEGEVGDREIGSGWRGVRVWCGVSAVVVFNCGVEFVSYDGFFGGKV